MLTEFIGMVSAALIAQAAVDPSALVRSDVTFKPRERAVSNWRTEAAGHLDGSLGVRFSLLLGRDPTAVTRCVRLNNYWCIKRAGWAGEIAADREGHVAFASAAEGAAVAALLLKRYYVDYGRHSAYAIVSRWAPASCDTVAVRSAPRARGGSAIRTLADHLAVHGIRGTLRARFLSGRGRRIAAGGRGLRGRASAIPDPLIGRTSAAPAIMAGIVEKPVDLTTQSLAALPLSALSSPPTSGGGGQPGARTAPKPLLACADETPRIKAYAARAAAGIARGIDADLGLFDGTGRPTPNLARLMHNMSAVEVGPLGADAALVAGAIDKTAALAGHVAERKPPARAAEAAATPTPAPAR